MPAGDVVEQRTQSRCRRWRIRFMSKRLRSGEATGKQTHRGAFDIAFDAGDLACETQARVSLQAQRAIEQLGRIEIRVAMQAAETRELGVLKSGDRSEHAHLLGVF